MINKDQDILPNTQKGLIPWQVGHSSYCHVIYSTPAF
jgi:hypothetical protein